MSNINNAMSFVDEELKSRRKLGNWRTEFSIYFIGNQNYFHWLSPHALTWFCRRETCCCHCRYVSVWLPDSNINLISLCTRVAAAGTAWHLLSTAMLQAAIKTHAAELRFVWRTIQRRWWPWLFGPLIYCCAHGGRGRGWLLLHAMGKRGGHKGGKKSGPQSRCIHFFEIPLKGCEGAISISILLLVSNDSKHETARRSPGPAV